MKILFSKLSPIFLRDLYKDTEIVAGGVEFETDLDLTNVKSVSVNFKVGDKTYTDSVEIKDNYLVVPFKTDVLKQGKNSFEVVAIMIDDSVEVSATCNYSILKSIDNTDSIEAETNYPILIDLISKVEDTIENIPTKEELKGEQGIQGIQGPKGDKGDVGATGPIGPQGPTGPRGIQGVKGDTPSITHLETSINNKIKEVDTRFNALTSKQQQDSEVIEARLGCSSLKEKIESLEKTPQIIYETIEG